MKKAQSEGYSSDDRSVDIPTDEKMSAGWRCRSEDTGEHLPIQHLRTVRSLHRRPCTQGRKNIDRIAFMPYKRG